MGTRSLTYVFSERAHAHDECVPLVCMYRQFDGYPVGHGQELAEFLLPFELVNGIPVGKAVAIGEVANGMGCLAAQLVAHFKKGVGSFYLCSTKLNQDCGQEYEYHVYEDSVRVFTSDADGTHIFKGTWKQFSDWCRNPTEEEEEEETKPDLRTALQNGVVTVTFTKADGTTRVMRCTTNVDYLPADAFGHAPKTGRINPHLFKVWDVEVKDWRSFREERVIEYTS